MIEVGVAPHDPAHAKKDARACWKQKHFNSLAADYGGTTLGLLHSLREELSDFCRQKVKSTMLSMLYDWEQELPSLSRHDAAKNRKKSSAHSQPPDDPPPAASRRLCECLPVWVV